MLTLPIQVGKRYVRRDGVVVEAYSYSPTLALVGPDADDPWQVVYRQTGRVRMGDHPKPFDLVEDASVEPTGIEAQVCQDIAARQALGVAKYGCTVAENPLQHRAWLQHAYEECLDQAIYLKRAMAE